MHGSGKLPWGRGLCTTCDQCRATSSLSHPITGWTLTRLTGAGQSSFCSLAVMVSHVARERWLEGVLDYTHRIQILQCTLGFVKRNYSPASWLFRHLCRLTSKETSKLCIIVPLWMADAFFSQKASNAESVSISWHYCVHSTVEIYCMKSFHLILSSIDDLKAWHLTHCGPMTPTGDIGLGHNWLR